MGLEIERDMELIKPMKRNVWGWPVIINFILGGMATGFYLLNFTVEILYRYRYSVFLPVESKLLAPLLVSLGFLISIVEVGRPLRGHHILRNLRSSWISREILFGGIFIISTVLDWLSPEFSLRILAAVTAIVFIISQGFIVYRAGAVISWSMPLIPVVFLASGITMGFGLVLLLTVFSTLRLSHDFLVLGLIFVTLDMVAWLIYLHSSHEAHFLDITGALRRPGSLKFFVGIGHVFPIMLVLVLLKGPSFIAGRNFQHILSMLAGLFIIASGIKQKFSLILMSNYLRGIEIEQPESSVHVVDVAASDPLRYTHGPDKIPVDSVGKR